MKEFSTTNECNDTHRDESPTTIDSSTTDVAHAISDLTKRNVTVAGKRTTIRLEPTLWQALENIAQIEQTNINQLCTDIASRQHGPSFTSAVRVFIVHYYMYAGQQSVVEEETTEDSTVNETMTP